ncbi:hypothetical protein [Psychromonas hadalis]|uniref:hypothetical protein n=1 Tax=Psychromonas hadalis TaxID=211669 RepID=UPI0003B42E6D|nr:hypothetical protein [Psychromonas hadalis]
MNNKINVGLRMLEDDEFELIMSPLCQPFELDGKSVQIDIYNGDNGGWLIEIVDEFNNSTVWNDEFPTEKAALIEAIETINEDGIDAFIGNKSEDLH